MRFHRHLFMDKSTLGTNANTRTTCIKTHPRASILTTISTIVFTCTWTTPLTIHSYRIVYHRVSDSIAESWDKRRRGCSNVRYFVEHKRSTRTGFRKLHFNLLSIVLIREETRCSNVNLSLQPLTCQVHANSAWFHFLRLSKDISKWRRPVPLNNPGPSI